MEKISAVIITFNEERNIGRCIDSVAGVADEILVVDSFSTDQTKTICSEKGARFEVHAFEGHIEQKNYAAGRAIHDLILSLDADEALSDELKQQILKVKQQRACDVYSMNRLTNYCGTWIRHSGWYPDRKIRLFDRRCGRWGGVNPHDRYLPEPDVSIGHLTGDILHYSYYSIEEHRAQIIRFANISANALHKVGKKSGYLKRFYKPAARFIKTYLLRAGFLDGKAGWNIAVMTARASWLRYTELHRLSKNKS